MLGARAFLPSQRRRWCRGFGRVNYMLDGRSKLCRFQSQHRPVFFLWGWFCVRTSSKLTGTHCFFIAERVVCHEFWTLTAVFPVGYGGGLALVPPKNTPKSGGID